MILHLLTFNQLINFIPLINFQDLLFRNLINQSKVIFYLQFEALLLNLFNFIHFRKNFNLLFHVIHFNALLFIQIRLINASFSLNQLYSINLLFNCLVFLFILLAN